MVANDIGRKPLQPVSNDSSAGVIPQIVMSVLERYSQREDALLLGCTVQDVVEAQFQALMQLPGCIKKLAETAEQP